MEDTLPQNPRPQLTLQDQLSPSTSSNTLKMAVVGLFILLPIMAVGVYYFGKSTTKNNVSSENPIVKASPSTEEGVVCTMDAKICPDGSSVGRTGPNCEFAECPTLNTTTDKVTFWYSSTHFMTHLQTLGNAEVYGVFETKANQELCSEHFKKYGTFYQSNQSLELYMPCQEKMYTVSVYKTSEYDFVMRLIPQAQQEYQDTLKRKWTYQQSENEGHYRVEGYIRLSENEGYAVTLETLASDQNLSQTQLLTTAKKTFDGFKVSK